MRGTVDYLARLDSPLHRWEPRCRLIGLGALIVAFSCVRRLELLPLLLLVATSIVGATRFPLPFLLQRIRWPGIFVTALALMLPVVVGSTTVARMGPLVIHLEGLQQMLIIVAKFLAIVLVGLVLFGSAPLATTVRSMRALGLPSVLADMTLFSYRFIHDIGNDLRTMRIAVSLRGLRLGLPSPVGLQTLASLLGSLFVRSWERAEQVHCAMMLRGYGQNRRAAGLPPVSLASLLATAAAVVAACALVAAELILRGQGS